jgi:hypothetical protein
MNEGKNWVQDFDWDLFAKDSWFMNRIRTCLAYGYERTEYFPDASGAFGPKDRDHNWDSSLGPCVYLPRLGYWYGSQGVFTRPKRFWIQVPGRDKPLGPFRVPQWAGENWPQDTPGAVLLEGLEGNLNPAKPQDVDACLAAFLAARRRAGKDA